MFKDRKEAGKKLAEALKKYKDKGVLVLAIPKGGIEVGYEVAKYLNAEFSVIVSRKLPFPGNPEFGFGAISEDGSVFIIDEYKKQLPGGLVEDIIQKQKLEINRRLSILREGKPLPRIEGKTVIIVDDGIAMGSTMRASINLCENKKAKKIIAASPVSGRRMESELAPSVDEVVILEKPVFFSAVAQAYENWHDVSDAEAVAILRKWGEFLLHK